MADLYSSSRMLPLLCVLMLGMLAQQQGADALYYPADKIVGYGDTWQGLSAPMLQAEWWKRLYSFSYARNPINTGDLSDKQQNVKRVFFLDPVDSASGAVVKQVTVKGNRALFFPLTAQGFYNTDLTPAISAYTGAASLFLSVNNFTAMTASVDGQRVRDPVQYIGGSSTFAYTFPGINEANIYNSTTFYDTRTRKFGLTSYPTFDYGVYLFLKPLPKGKHIIKVKAQSNDLSFKADVKYVVTVV